MLARVSFVLPLFAVTGVPVRAVSALVAVLVDVDVAADVRFVVEEEGTRFAIRGRESLGDVPRSQRGDVMRGDCSKQREPLGRPTRTSN